MSRFHRVTTVEGREVEVIGEDHLRDLLIAGFKWAIFSGIGISIGAGIFFAKIYGRADDAAKDIAALREMRASDTARANRRDENLRILTRRVDSMHLLFHFVQPQIIELSEDIKALRRVLRQPR
jgi:hypothetical protein